MHCYPLTIILELFFSQFSLTMEYLLIVAAYFQILGKGNKFAMPLTS